jgi:hypothetical protein
MSYIVARNYTSYSQVVERLEADQNCHEYSPMMDCALLLNLVLKSDFEKFLGRLF